MMFLLDLAGALPRSQEGASRISRSISVLLGVPVTAVDPEALLGDLRAEFTARYFAIPAATSLRPRVSLSRGGVAHHQMCRFDFCSCHLSELEGNGLVLGDRLAEGAAL